MKPFPLLTSFVMSVLLLSARQLFCWAQAFSLCCVGVEARQDGNVKNEGTRGLVNRAQRVARACSGVGKKPRQRGRSLLPVLVVFIAGLAIAAPVTALTINLTFDAVSDSPTFDPTGALLQPIMQASADYWEDIIQDAGTLDIRYYYDDLSDTNNTLANHSN